MTKWEWKMVFPVQVGSYQHLIPVSPKLPGQLHADLVGQLRGTLPRSETLVAVVGDDAFFLPKALLHRLHFLTSGGWGAVDAGDKLPYRRSLFLDCSFPLLGGIAEQISQIRLFGVGGIVQDTAQIPPHRPQGGHRHVTSSGAGSPRRRPPPPADETAPRLLCIGQCLSYPLPGPGGRFAPGGSPPDIAAP